MLVRRVFFVPADLSFKYYEVFSELGNVYLSNSIFSSFIKYPFSYPPQLLVSMYALGNESWANSGFLATSFMHFNVFGVILFSFIVAVLIKIVDSLVENKLPVWLGVAIVITPFSSLFKSSDLFTSLLTHGLLLSLILLWFIRK